MEAGNSSRKVSAKMAFTIDLNETPISSPREAGDDAIVGSASTSVCTVCRKGVPVGMIPDKLGGHRPEQKCFRCLLKSSKSEVGRFDMNASPPREAEEGCGAPFVTGRDEAGGGRVQTSSSFSGLRRDSTFAVGLRGSHPTPVEFPPESPNMLYLQILRKYISEKSGILGEGWRVEFEFCNIRYKTSAVYISPDGRRFRSMEDVACHLGLPSQCPANKESSPLLTGQSCRQRQKISRSSKSHGFLSSSGISSCSQDAVHASDGFPVQFHDFCLISTGNIDPRPSYHNTSQIWPVAYRSSWHDRVTGSLFHCDVADGGEHGPIFKIQRYPCTTHAIPVGSTVLRKMKSASCNGDDIVGKDDLTTCQVFDDDSMSTITLLYEDTPPCLDNFLSTPKREEEVHNLHEDNSSISNMEVLPLRPGNPITEAVGLNDFVGEFQVEGRSTSSVWEMVSQAFLNGCKELYEQKGVVKLFCNHDVYGIDSGSLDGGDSLSRYCYFGGLSIPPLVQSENELNMSCDMLSVWLKQDRFGLDADFVQEIIEQLPRVSACSEYKKLNDRKNNSGLQTVGSGFLQTERKTSSVSETSKRSLLKWGDTEDTLKRDPCPPGKQLNSRLPSYLMGATLQVWELAWRFREVLGLGQPFTFQELESELLSPWSDTYALDSRPKIVDTGDAASSSGKKVSQAGVTGLLLAKILGSLLKLLVTELFSKVAVYVCPNFDAGESKSRRGRKKDLDYLAALKKRKLDMLPVNELTWHEITRRYTLAVLSMDGNLDSAEVVSRESGKVFHCLQGDGGVLCGSLTGIAALEGDAVVLVDANKEIFGSLKTKNEIISLCERESDANGTQTIEVNDGVIPEWAKVLEPVRKLPTNVGARIRKCINEALEKNPPEWAKKQLEHSISKEVYKGNASGPTKRAVISVLANVTSENPQQKNEKKEKVKIKTNMSDLITKQCRIVLRQAAASDEKKSFCNLLARVMLNPNDNDDKGVLGYPAMVSRPIDFRTIDLRLAAGVYGGSHEAFADDVREVWCNIRTANAYGDRSDSIEKLSKMFEDLYEKEVLTLVHKMAEISNVNDSSADAVKQRNDLLLQVCNSSLPIAPWEDGICKVCGMDKDDDNVLLCDKCDSEYHRYCLDPPLLRIPEGNWYCPSCVTGQSIHPHAAYGSVKKRKRGEFSYKFLEELARFAELMETREHWEFTIDQRMFFLKFLFDEALNSATVRDHMDQCASRATDLQQKLRSLTSDLKKAKEDVYGLSIEKVNSGIVSGRGDLRSDASSSKLDIENISRGKSSEKGDQSQPDNILVNVQLSRGQQKSEQRHANALRDVQGSLASAINVPTRPVSSSNHCPDQADMFSSQDNSLKVDTVKNDITNLMDSIASVEAELVKVSLRKDFLGRDSNGRAYWAFYCPGARPWIMACGELASKQKGPQDFVSIPGSDKWMYYESGDDIEKLFNWLSENNAREKELRESILLFQINKLKDSKYTDNHILNKGEKNDNGRKYLSANILATKAMSALEKKFGPCTRTEAVAGLQSLALGASQGSRMYRCDCLELLWPSRDHCFSCHRSFPTFEELRQHSTENCTPVASSSKKIQTTEEIPKRKKSRVVASQEKRVAGLGISQTPSSEKQAGGSSFVSYHADCPFNFNEIMTRFIVPSSVKDEVNSIGLIGNGGVPSSLPSRPPYLIDPALSLSIGGTNEASSSNTKGKASKFSRFVENGSTEDGSAVQRLKTSERDQVSSRKDKSSVIGLSKSNIIRESSSRPLVGRGAEILRFLKMNLLDMDAALPQDALRKSRTSQERRCAWRAFVKSAVSIYAMVQAVIVLEDTIKSEYLQNDWWYWSSPSTAARITTVSALALRIYSLDAAISYDKPLTKAAPEASGPLEEEKQQSTPPKNVANSSSPPLQTTPEPEPSENPRTRSRSNKRKKASE
ncbi:hypothetical protein ACS0TY_010093 [Phlomoides rotata]